MLRSDFAPDMNSIAVAPLMTMPTAATQMTVLVTTASGRPIRPIASHAMPPMASSSTTAFIIAARIDVLRNP